MGWISVKDRLPRHGAEVDIWLQIGGRVTNLLYVSRDGDDPYFYDGWDDSRYKLDKVSHWMPLTVPSGPPAPVDEVVEALNRTAFTPEYDEGSTYPLSPPKVDRWWLSDEDMQRIVAALAKLDPAP